MLNTDKIKQVYAQEILDSRGNPTLEVTVTTKKGITAQAKVPSGASVGIHEALELRDEDAERYGGKGVLKAINNVNTIINDVLKDQKVDELTYLDQRMIDLDGTPNKAKLGANATIGVSLALARAAAEVHGMSLYGFINDFYKFKQKEFKLPIPLSNIINGGKHADSNLDIQEFWICPQGITIFKDKIKAMSEIYHVLAKVLVKQGYDSDVGDEGGYAPDLGSNEEAIKLIIKAVEEAGYSLGNQIFLGMDCGASTYYNNTTKKYELDLDKISYTSGEMITFYQKWLSLYPFIALEDPLGEDDWEAWKKITDEFTMTGSDIMIVGDDLFTTNTTRLQKGIDEKVANSIIIKPNQIGTLLETINCIKLAQENKYKVILSHRSGETADTFISDLAVGVGAEYIKTGAPSRSERVEKYNRLLEIENELKR
ncbi:phosphopyruvate hydratase [bacterium]|jgi:enolase|nr:phosphopyruvate hydratase [bacterium]MBT4335071.1 phosphopyruvate hydratase [bacterium]MBT4495929.1 phosphopyruvate hydratase [bacterium]MBT4764285.1 phosphopyruvate hydratase [bacterium]MBT5401655.1 phosphopyruvate hydratase [bacterium]